MIRGSIRYPSRKYWDELAGDLKPIYQAYTPIAAEQALDALQANWGNRHPAIIGLWRSAWAEFVPFLDYTIEIRRVLCSTNPIESVNARYAARSAPAVTSRTSSPR